ncbi:MAG: outer membrane lipoprotein-sorting protein [Myxococcales bacterium]
MSNRTKRMKTLLGVSAALSLLAPQDAQAIDRNTTDPRAIMQAAAEQQGGERGLSRMKMTIRQGSSTRERAMTVRTWRQAEVRKVLILIEAPEDVRNTGFLTLDYAAKERADEQWLYLPALHRVSRVPSSGKSDAFVGSDFSISDLSGVEPADYDFQLLEVNAKVGDEECWLIESIPRNDEVRAKTGYSKGQIWVSKSKLIPIQFKAWTLSPGKTKYFKAGEIKLVDGVWTPHRLQMRTLQEGGAASETLIEVLSVKNRADEVSDADFTQRRLERGI